MPKPQVGNGKAQAEHLSDSVVLVDGIDVQTSQLGKGLNPAFQSVKFSQPAVEDQKKSISNDENIEEWIYWINVDTIVN